ncbi:hypothetical protein F2Q70_00038291 [Brassica cretica]|uniref:Uncharacterized protein n=1 Tax=Brassica cretica TaxID=69181 RepID=A0A8S9K9U6_BRACR|nr:hypothetical protein F2Q70_00038291 [Brassica cretica]
MSSSHGDKRSSDVEMGEATSPVPILTSPVEAPACIADHLSFREKLVRRQAEKEKVRASAELQSSSALAVAPGHGTEGVTPRDTGTLAGSVGPDASALPAGSSTTPILVEDKGRAADSMPPPLARKEIVLALHAPSVVPVTQPKGRKRKFTKGGDGESSQQGGSSIASGLRGKLGHYVATELWLEPGCYLATELWLKPGCYVATELWLELGLYVATELWLEIGRYVATELLLELGRYVETEVLVRARSLHSDRAEQVFGCCVATLFELLSDDSCFFRKAFS